MGVSTFSGYVGHVTWLRRFSPACAYGSASCREGEAMLTWDHRNKSLPSRFIDSDANRMAAPILDDRP